MSDNCELCLNEISTRVFPCLYHCKKMLCLQHLSEHEKSIEQQVNYQNQLNDLWKDYNLKFNEKRLLEQLHKLRMKLSHFQKLKQETKELLSIKRFNNSLENLQRFEKLIQRVRQAIEEENASKMLEHDIYLKVETVTSDEDDDEEQRQNENQSMDGNTRLMSSITTNEEPETIVSIYSENNSNGNSPSEDERSEHAYDFDDHETPIDNEDNSVFNDKTSATSSGNVTASGVYDYCPLTYDGAFGISSVTHGVRLCPNRRSQRRRHLYKHFRYYHHLTSAASRTLARAVGSEQDPSTTKLFSDHHLILYTDDLRKMNCPIQKSFSFYPTLQIKNMPCNKIRQIQYLKSHLKRVHKFSNQATTIIMKSVKSNTPVDKIRFPRQCTIIENPD